MGQLLRTLHKSLCKVRKRLSSQSTLIYYKIKATSIIINYEAITKVLTHLFLNLSPILCPIFKL